MLLAALPGLGFLSGRVHSVFVADADFLLLHELLPDLASGGSVSTWNIPYATYLFPDWPLYGLSLLIGPTPAATIAVFATLQLLLLSGALWLVAGGVDTRAGWPLAAVALGPAVFAVLWNAFPAVYLAASYVHGGTAIATVALLGLLLRWACRPTPALLATSAALTFAGVASDRLFAVWGLVPAGAAVVVLAIARIGVIRQHATWLGVHAVAAVAGLPVANVLFPERANYDLELGFQPRFGYRRFEDSIRTVDDLSPLLLPAVGLATVVLTFVLFRGRSLVGRHLPAHARLVVGTFVLVAVATTVAAQVAMVGPVPPHARYSIAAFVLPLVVAPVLALAGIADRNRQGVPVLQRLAVGAAALPLLAVLATTATWIDDVRVDRLERPIDCVEKVLVAGSNRGISSYWDARQFQVYSEGRLVMSEYEPLLVPMDVNSNRDEVAESYDFAVVSALYGGFDLPPERIRAVAGTPMTEQACGPWTVLDYGPGGLSLQPFKEVGSERTFDGCILGGHVGTTNGVCARVATTADGPGYLVFGPYVPAPAGNYRAVVSYRSDEAPGATVGSWDVTRDPGGQDIVAAGGIRGTDGEPSELVVEFGLAEAPGQAVLQWRLVTRGSVDVTVHSIKFERTR